MEAVQQKLREEERLKLRKQLDKQKKDWNTAGAVRDVVKRRYLLRMILTLSTAGLGYIYYNGTHVVVKEESSDTKATKIFIPLSNKVFFEF